MHRNGRTGAFTLVEMLAVMAVATVILGLALGLVSRAMRIASLSKQKGDLQHTVVRLVNDFRRDVHSASDLELFERPNKPTEVRLTQAATDGSATTKITYWFEPTAVQRESTTGDERTHREYYRLADGIQIHVAQQNDWRAVFLTIQRELEIKSQEPKVVAHAEVEIGRLLRLVRSGSDDP